jgi:hypothetical protein
MPESFAVVLFFPDGSYVYERRGLDAESAVKLAKECSERPAATIGMIARIIITDDGDHTVFEWKYREGVTWPEHTLP